MAKIIFAFPPRLGDCAEICLVGVSAGGLPTRPREQMFVHSPYVELVQIKKLSLQSNDTMKMPLHGIFPSVVAHTLLTPLH